MTMPSQPIYLQPTLTTVAAIKNRLLLNAVALGGFDTSEGSFEDDLLGTYAIELVQAADLPQRLFARVFINTAVGTDLDAQADQTGITPRIPAVTASGIIQINAPAGTVIPIGTRVGTGTTPARTATTDATVTVAVGATNVGVSAHDTIAGKAGNLPIGAYIQMVDVIAGVVSAVSTTTFAGGVDAETDTQLRARIKLARQQPGASANRAQMRNIALAIAGVGGVGVLYANSGTPPVLPGEARVTLIDPAGLPASATLVETVRDALSQPQRVTSEAEAMVLGGASVIDGTQPGSVGTSVHMPPNVAASITQSRIDLVLPQGGPYEMLPRMKRGAVLGVGSLYQIGAWDLTTGTWCLQSALSALPAVYVLPGSVFPTAFDSVYVGDFFANLLDQIELRITKYMTAMATPTVAPTLVAVTDAAATLLTGTFTVGYTWRLNGVTMIGPTAAIAITAGQRIDVTTPAPPTGASADIYVSPAAGNAAVIYHGNSLVPTVAYPVRILPTGAVPPVANTTVDTTTDIWVDNVFYRSAMQRVDKDQAMPGFFRLRVQPATNVPVDIHVTLTYTVGFDPIAVRAAVRAALAGAPTTTSLGGYFTTIPYGTGLNQTVQVAAIGDAIFRTPGVASYDFSSLTVQGAQANLTITLEQRATLRDLIINGIVS